MELRFNSIVEQVLVSWTALELAVAHFDGQYRTAQDKRIYLYTILCEIIPDEKYTVVDIAEYLADFMLEEFSLELDDNSHFDVSNLLISAWSMIKQGKVFTVSINKSGAVGSVLRSDVVEVEEDSPCESVDAEKKERQCIQMETDEDGWSTIVRK